MNKMLTVGTKFSGIGKIPILGSSRLKTLNSTIKAMFAKAEQGFAYDPNDLTTLYQDAAGTIPVTAAGQPVGLMLDKSKPITNISILDSAFLLADGWVKNNPEISVSSVDGSLRVSKEVVSPNSIYRPFSCESGKLYRLTVKYKNHTGNNVRFFVRNANNSGVNLVLSQSILTFTNTAGEGTTFFISNSNTHSVSIDSQNAADSSIDITSIAITKVSDSSNHAYQTASASRPILQQLPTHGNELVVNGNFSAGLANWVQQGTAVSSVTAGVLSITAQGTSSGVYQDIPTVVGRTYELDFRSTGGVLVILYASAAFSPPIPNTNTPRMTFVATSSVTRLYAYCNGSNTGTIDNISLKPFTGFRTDQNYLKFDAVDDKLITNLPAQLTGCTVIRSVPNVGTQILTGQTIPATYEDNIYHCGLLVINRALTASETSQITRLFNKSAGV